MESDDRQITSTIHRRKATTSRKGSTFYRKLPTTLPPDRPLYRTKGCPTSHSSPGETALSHSRHFRYSNQWGPDAAQATAIANNPASSPRRRARNLGLLHDLSSQ
eukprot:scaffold192791_cov37-Prasinocladus_malaysianus.AAC.1